MTINEIQIEDKKSKKNQQNAVFKPISLKAHLLLLTFLNLSKRTFQVCVKQDLSSGMGQIRFWYHQSSNNTIRTMDHFGVYRVLDMTTNNVVYELDFMPILNSALDKTTFESLSESWIKGGTFEIDTGIERMFIVTRFFIYVHDFSTKGTVMKSTNPESSQYTQKVQYIGGEKLGIMYKDTLIGAVNRDSDGYSIITTVPSNAFDEIFSSVSSDQAVLQGGYRVFYYVRNPNFVGALAIKDDDNTVVPADRVMVGWTNVTSNIAVKASDNAIAFGVNKTGSGGVGFRNLFNQDRFSKDILTPFTSCVFDSAAANLITYRPEGEACIIAYNLVGETITEGACHVVMGPFAEMSVLGGKLVLFMESTIAVYNYDTDMSLGLVYNPQPVFSEQIVGSTDQFHIFPNLKLRKFDTTTKAYDSGEIFSGEISQAKVNPHNTAEIFILVGMTEIKRITITTKAVAATYSGIHTTVLAGSATDYTDYKILSFDIYKVATTKLGLIYKTKKAAALMYLYIEYDYNANTGSFEELAPTTDGYLNLVRLGIIDSKDTQILGYSDTFNFFKIDAGLGGSKVSVQNIAKNYFDLNTNIEIVENTDTSVHTFVLTSLRNVLTVNFEGAGTNNVISFSVYLGKISNCLPKTAASETVGAVTIPEMTWCGGGMFFKEYKETLSVYSFQTTMMNKLTGVVFKGSDNKYYIQQNENNRVKYEGDSEECWYTDFDFISLADRYKCNDPDCVICDENTGHICKTCKNSKVASGGVCVAGDCPSPKFSSGGACLDECPIRTYEAVVGTARTCETSCTGVTGKTDSFGNICSACPDGSTASGGKCGCPAGKLNKHDETCVTGNAPDCPTGYFWHHYGMCVDSARTGYTIYNGKEIYCDSSDSVNFDDKTCISVGACGAPKLTGTHPSYGRICVTDTQCKTDLNYFKYATDNKCVLACPEWGDRDTNDCVSSCGAKLPYEEGGKKECYTNCPSGTYHDKINSKCVDTCPTTPGTIYTDVVNNECVTTCASPLIFHPTENKCIAACPTTPTQYYEKADRTCVTITNCKGAEKLYASVNDKKCIKPCAGANPLLVPSTLECVAACPSVPTLTYKIVANNSCETKAACGAYTTPSQHFSTDSTQLCDTSCASPLFQYSPDKSCVTAAVCTGTSGYYTLDDTTDLCVNKAECDSASRLTLEEDKSCIAACPTSGSTYKFKYVTGTSCLTAAQCTAVTDHYTLTDTASSCVNKAGCNSASRLTLDEDMTCIATCPTSGTYLYKYTTETSCLTAAQCTAKTNHYTLDDTTKLCVDKAGCNTATRLTLEEDKTCIAACPTTGSNLWKYVADKSCLTAAQCTAKTSHYTLDDTTKLCVDKAGCNTATRLTLAEDKTCIAACPTTGSNLWKYTTETSCLTAAQCTAKTNHYTLDDTTKLCVDKAGCTGASRLTLSEDKTCIAACPTTGSDYQWKYDTDKSCLTPTQCRAVTNHYTFNDTTKVCIPGTTCTGASNFLVEEYKDCNPTSCPASIYKFKDSGNTKCYSKVGCTALSHYTTTPGDTCTSSCSTPYTDEGNKECVSSCSAGTFGISAENVCLSQQQCADRPEDRWGDAPNKECLATCSKKKNVGEKLCIDSCPDQEDASTSRCYSTFEISFKEVKRDDHNKTFIMELEVSVADLDLKKELITEIKTTNITNSTTTSEEVISSYEFEIKSDKIISIKLESKFIKEKVKFELKFDTALDTFTKSNQPVKPQLYRTATATLDKEIDKLPEEEDPNGNPGGDQNVTVIKREIQAWTSFYLVPYTGLQSIIPTISPIIQPLSWLNFLPYQLRAFSKLHLYTYFNFKMTKDYDSIYLSIFRDIFEVGSKEIFSQIGPEALKKDKEIVCDERSGRLCYVKLVFSFLINKLLSLVVLVLCFFLFGGNKARGIKGKEAVENVKTGTFVNFWIGHQLSFLFALSSNVVLPRFDNFTFAVSWIISMLVTILILASFLYIVPFKKYKTSKYLNDVADRFATKLFKTKTLVGIYFLIQLGFDVLMVVALLALQHNPKTQTALWLFIELTLLVLVLIIRPFKKIKGDLLNVREIVKQTLFVLIALFVTLINIKEETTDFLSACVFFLSLTLLVCDTIISIIIYYITISNWVKTMGNSKKDFNKVKPVHVRSRGDLDSLNGGDRTSKRKLQESSIEPFTDNQHEPENTDNSLGRKLPPLRQSSGTALKKKNIVNIKRAPDPKVSKGYLKGKEGLMVESKLKQIDEVKESYRERSMKDGENNLSVSKVENSMEKSVEKSMEKSFQEI